MKKAGRAAGRAFQEDSFHNYMARKIDLQRQQFGVVLPPPPPQQQQQHSTRRPPPAPSRNTRVSFGSTTATKGLPPRPPSSRSFDVQETTTTTTTSNDKVRTSKKRKRRPHGGMMDMMRRLQRRHGGSCQQVIVDDDVAKVPPPPFTDKKENQSSPPTVRTTVELPPNDCRPNRHHRTSTTSANASTTSSSSHLMTQVPVKETDESEHDNSQTDDNEAIKQCKSTLKNDEEDNDKNYVPTVIDADPASTSTTAAASPLSARNHTKNRPDLFFWGIVVLINGYTHPDAESLQRMLQQHGGDVERYETTRVTHVVAEHLSTAKAKLYQRRRNPTPVVHPSWIVDCVQQHRRLPHAPYLLPEVRDNTAQPSVAHFWGRRRPPAATAKAPGTTDRQETPPLRYEVETGDHKNTTTTTDSPKFLPEADQQNQRTSENSENCTKESKVGEPLNASAKLLIHNPYHTCHRERGMPVRAEPPQTPSQNRKSTATDPSASSSSSSPLRQSPSGRTDDKYINGKIRTVGTDPNFLETFFAQSRLSFIGSFRQRAGGTCSSTATTTTTTTQADERNAKRRPSKRFVLHVDMDSFFAAVVLRNYPEYRDKPVAICHFGKSGPDSAELAGKESTSECATINYEARKFGLQKGMFLGRARALCPSLVVLPYDFQGYEEVSEQVSEICHRYAAEHLGTVEAVSCDESYMEVFVEDVEIVRAVAEAIRHEIFETTQCTATIGIANNKFLAKLATDKVKPNGLFVANDHVALLKDLQLRDLHGIGYRSEPKLKEKGFVSVQDVWDRGESAEVDLQTILGKQLGSKIYNFCQGVDNRPVQAAERKTIGAEVRWLCFD